MGARPRVYKTEGIILRRRNIGEADSISPSFHPTKASSTPSPEGYARLEVTCAATSNRLQSPA